jgi:hypothetical protein
MDHASTDQAHAAAALPMTEVNADASDDAGDDRRIGAEAVSRAKSY